jgi:hypothetical protein
MTPRNDEGSYYPNRTDSKPSKSLKKTEKPIFLIVTPEIFTAADLTNTISVLG